MDWAFSLSLSVALILALFFTGVPVFVAFLAVNVAGVLWLMGTSGFGLFANSIYQTVTSGSLAAVPLFILMGEILFRSGTVDTLIESIDTVVGQVRARDYVVIAALSAIFGALCGSTVAVAALLGRTVMPSMRRRGYDVRLTAGVIAGGATLAAVIPPSVAVIVLGSLVDVSIASLLISGILPGLLITLLILTYTYVRILLQPSLEPPREGGRRPPVPWSRRALALVRTLPFGLVMFSVMGLLMLGIATPSESAATGVLGAMVAAAIHRRLNVRTLLESLGSTVELTAMILVILASARLFGQLLSFIGAPAGLMRAATALNLSAGWMLFVLLAAPFVLCMFIDLIAVMLVAVPIYLPIMKVYGFDPVWFWMIFLINIALGSMTPPFGYTLFALKGAAPDVSLEDIYMGAWPVAVLFIIGMAIMCMFPNIVTVLPSIF